MYKFDRTIDFEIIHIYSLIFNVIKLLTKLIIIINFYG